MLPKTSSGFSLWRNASNAYDTYFEAELTIQQSNTGNGGEAIAGIGLFADGSNNYTLLLRENPKSKKHSVELNATFMDEWDNLETLGKYLSTSGGDFSWKFNTLYKLVFFDS